MLKTLFLILLLILIIYVLHRLTVSYKPIAIVNPEGQMQQILASMKMMNEKYKPTPWLVNCHIHTIWGMRIRGRTNIQPRRETVFFEDGGQVYIDWFEKESTPKDAPILFIEHTLGGGTREPCTNRMGVYAMNHGWRALVCTCRACNGSKITAKRLYNGYQTDDLHKIVETAKAEFPDAKNRFLIGYSLGSMISVQYAVDFDDIDAVMCVSHPLDSEQALLTLAKPLQKKLYMPAIMHSLQHPVEKSTFYVGEQREKALSAKNMFEFDDCITAKNLGLNTYKEYYALLELGPKCLTTKVPILLFNSEDDPFTLPSLIPADAIKESTKTAFITTKEGGHVSFCEGMDGKNSYIERFATDYFETVAKLKNNS